MNKNAIMVRFDTKVQLQRVRQAAKLRHWSVNRFVIEATEEAVNLLTTEKQSEQLTPKSDLLTLNQ